MLILSLFGTTFVPFYTMSKMGSKYAHYESFWSQFYPMSKMGSNCHCQLTSKKTRFLLRSLQNEMQLLRDNTVSRCVVSGKLTFTTDDYNHFFYKKTITT